MEKHKETICNVETRRKKRKTPSDKSNPSKHINSHLGHIFTWSIICNASTNKFKRKVIETYFIAIIKPILMINWIQIHYIFLEMV